VLVTALSAVALVAGVSVYFRVEQYRFRRQAERLLADVRELELKKASAEEVRQVVARWGFGESPPDKPCTEDSCDYYLELDPSAAPIFELFGKGREAAVTTILTSLGRRPFVVQAWIRVRRKTLRSEIFQVGMPAQAADGYEETLTGYAGSRWGSSSDGGRDRPVVTLEHSLLHPGYLVGKYPATLNADMGASPADVIWAEFSPDASPSDLSRLMQFNLGCLTRLRSCKESDLMPTVWAQSLEDSRASQANFTCTPEVSKRAARLADVIAVARPTTVVLQPPLGEGQPLRLPDLGIVSLIERPKHSRLRVGPGLEVEVDSLDITAIADSGAQIQAGGSYIFLLRSYMYSGRGAPVALYPCGILTLNDANLAMVREVAAESEQDPE
jgi:hypothetical protein